MIMTIAQTNEATPQKPLRLWPGVVIVALLWLISLGLPVVAPDDLLITVMAGPVGGLAIVLWWLFLSRAAWPERLGAVALMIVGLFATKRIIDVSIATGAQGLLYYLLSIPVVTSALVVWAVATRSLPNGIRRATMAATILLACGAFALIKTGGFTASSFKNDLHWRWAKTAEDRLVVESGSKLGALPPVRTVAAPPAETPVAQPGIQPGSGPSAPPPARAADASKKPLTAKTGSEAAKLALASPGGAPASIETGPDWPGFRGPHRNDVVSGVRIKTDWTASPPVALWRRPVGPGWSSFAVRGGMVYTQEQRGPDEIVACYKLATGEPVWAHRDTARFWESNGGPGPRGTPTLYKGRVYTFGATGILNVLDAADGAVVWSRNAASDTGMDIPHWGFAASPLVVDDLVIVATSGRLAAFDRATGAKRWMGPARGVSYSSPHPVTIDGVAQVLLLSEPGLTSVALADGTLLWEYPWPGYPIVQPALTADGDILISVSDSSGTRRLAVARGPTGWKVEERWTSNGLKPYFNDFVVHNGYAFGFDGSILACIDLKDGKRIWKGGRYGNGQLLLLADQDVLLVTTEEGELALVKATPDQFTELARFPALDAKTWNHPVLVGDVLLVRNGEEMAAFHLPLAGR
jgi:outer membrane protein assembly factor BamB